MTAMINRPDVQPLERKDRLELAFSWLASRFVERDGFLSADDVLTAAETFTTDKSGQAEWGDFEALAASLEEGINGYLLAVGVAVDPEGSQ